MSVARLGVAMQTPDDLVGQVVEDRYRIESPLGSGGMGVVYLARHVKVGREVAIKVLHGHLLSDPTMVERFEREAAIAARLAHRNLVSVIDVGETAGKQKLMVLELARGENLAAIVARGALPRERVIALVSQILEGLEHAHDAGLVHRDLKPENVIVEVDEHGVEIPRIVDFGVALLKSDERRLTTAGVVLGTPQYMAPEHAQGHAVDPRTDLFALGVMVYEMLGGKLPFDGSGVDVALANITRDPPSIRERTGVAVDPLLEAFARRLMARRLADRFQCARAALDVLELIDTRPEAAREILMPRSRFETVTPTHRITSLGTEPARPVTRARGSTPPGTFAARTIVPAAARDRRVFTPRALATAPIEPGGRAGVPGIASTKSRLPAEMLALAATVEAEGTATKPRRRSRVKRPPQPARPWQPWKSFGSIAGAVIAVLTLAGFSIASRLSHRVVSQEVPAIAVTATIVVPRISITSVTHEPAAPLEAAVPRSKSPRLR